MKWELHPKQSNLSRKLYVVRLRHKPISVVYSVGSTYYRGQGTVAHRARNVARELPRPLRFPDQKRWQPDHGRESPREEWMSWREFGDRIKYPGSVGSALKLRAMDQTRRLREYGSATVWPKMYTLDRFRPCGSITAAEARGEGWRERELAEDRRL